MVKPDVAAAFLVLVQNVVASSCQVAGNTEGGVERFLAKLAPLLRRHGLQLQVRSVQDPHRAGDPELDYVVEINGVRCTVWRPQEWEGATPGRRRPSGRWRW